MSFLLTLLHSLWSFITGLTLTSTEIHSIWNNKIQKLWALRNVSEEWHVVICIKSCQGPSQILCVQVIVESRYTMAHRFKMSLHMCKYCLIPALENKSTLSHRFILLWKCSKGIENVCRIWVLVSPISDDNVNALALSALIFHYCTRWNYTKI